MGGISPDWCTSYFFTLLHSIFFCKYIWFYDHKGKHDGTWMFNRSDQALTEAPNPKSWQSIWPTWTCFARFLTRGWHLSVISCHGRNTTGYCWHWPHLTSGGVPTSSDRHKACPVTGQKAGPKAPECRIVGLPVPKFRLKPTKHSNTMQHPSSQTACLHQSSMAMRHHPDLLRCESPHANASVFRWPGGTWSRASVESTSCSFNLFGWKHMVGGLSWFIYMIINPQEYHKEVRNREFTNYSVNIQYCTVRINEANFIAVYIYIYIYYIIIWYLACNIMQLLSLKKPRYGSGANPMSPDSHSTWPRRTVSPT